MSKAAINFLGEAISQKVPRFIYHMTSKKNAESIFRDGFLKMSRSSFVEGVYAIELTNFFKRWRIDNSWGNRSLQKLLIMQAAKLEDEIVIFRIPTAKLNINNLKIRSQNSLFGFANSHKEQIDNIRENIIQSCKSDSERAAKFKETISTYLDQNIKEEQLAQMMRGDLPAHMNKHYTQKKQALEYIYRDDISVKDIEQIGEISRSELRRSADYDPERPMRSIFTALLKDTPECKGAELLNC